jgi:hypothetical protein
MKKPIFVLLSVFLFSAAHAQIENTRWKTIIDAGTRINAIIDFKKDSLLVYTVAEGRMIERMTYSKKGDSFTLLKIDGQSDCDDGSKATYGFVIKGDSLFITLIKDDCSDRYTTLANTRWSKWKEYHGIKLPDALLKSYTGVYARDAAHPITISLENGILYAEGPNNQLPKSPFTAITASRFFLRIAGVEMDFVKDKNGKIVTLVSHEEKDYELKKIK